MPGSGIWAPARPPKEDGSGLERPAEGSPEEATWQPGRVMGGC